MTDLCTADRLSVYEGDPGFANYDGLGERRHSIRILLDGVEQKDVVTADRSQGWLRRFTMVDGRPVQIGNRLQTEVVKGRVEFEFTKGVSA